MFKATALLLLFMTLSMFAMELQAKEVQIIEIRKNLQLSNDEPVFTDYYLNAGADLGIKPGTTFVLYRRVNVIDRLGTNQGRSLSLPVGKIKIIYVAKDLSVARVESLEENKNTPILEHRGVMLGDLINVVSAGISEGDAKGEGNYGPQGLDVSFTAQPIITSVLPQIEESRMPAAIEAPQTSRQPEVLKAKPSSNSQKNNVETIKSSNDNLENEQLPLIR